MHLTQGKRTRRTVAPTLQSMKGIFPFRLGTTSYILPDGLVTNVEFLGPLVDDVELVLFESEEVSNLPGADIIISDWETRMR